MKRQQRQSRKVEIKPEKFFNFVREQKMDKIRASIRGIDFEIDSNNLALFIAAYLGNVDITRLLISHKADINYHWPDILPLSTLEANKNIIIKRNIHDSGISQGSHHRFRVVASPTLEAGATPLMAGVYSKNYLQIIPLLVQAKADINAHNARSHSVVSHAVHAELPGPLRALLESKARPVHFENGNPFHLLHFAAGMNKNTEILQLLLDLKADVNDTQNVFGQTPLHGLLFSKNRTNQRMVEFLIDHKADVNIKSAEGDTALDYLKSSLRNTDSQEILCGQPVMDEEYHASLKKEGLAIMTVLMSRYHTVFIKFKFINESALSLPEDLNKTGASPEIKAMKSEVEKLVKIIEKSEETLNASLQYFGMNLEQLRKNKINPLIQKTETLENFMQRMANLDKSLASYSRIEPVIHKKFSDIKLKLAKIKGQQQKFLQEKFNAELEKKREESRTALSPLFQWHLQEQWKNVNHDFTVHYKIFWKLSEKYAKERQQLTHGQALNQDLDFASLEMAVQQAHKQKKILAQGANPTTQDFKEIENSIEVIEKKTLQLEQMQRRFCKKISPETKSVEIPVLEKKEIKREPKPKQFRKMGAPAAISLPKAPTVKKIRPPSQSIEPGYYNEYKKSVVPAEGNSPSNLSDIIIAVDQISQLKNTVVRIIQINHEDKNDDDAEISLLALLGIIVRFNSMLQSMPQLISASSHFSSNAKETINQIRNALFVFTSSLDSIKKLPVKNIQTLGHALKDLMTAYALKIGGKHISVEVLIQRLEDFNTVSSLLIASTHSSGTEKNRQDYCQKMLGKITAKLSSSPESSVMEMLFNALMFVGGLTGKIKTQSHNFKISPAARSNYSVLAQARHQAFPDYSQLMDAIVSLMSLGELELEEKYPDSSSCSASSFSTVSSMKFSFADSSSCSASSSSTVSSMKFNFADSSSCSTSSSSTASSMKFSFADLTAPGPALFSPSSRSSRAEGVTPAIAPSKSIQPG